MADVDWELYMEADKRGLLKGDKKELYDEAVRRGMVPGMQAQPQEPVSGTDVAIDTAKSLGTGLGQGVLGLATTVGNLEGLGRAGINWAGRKLGATEDVVDPQPYYTDYNTLKRGIERDITGKFYEPKTTAGEYARTIGEYAPAAFSPGSAVRKGLSVLAPAIGSETAGQLTKGSKYEPLARVAGGFAGAYAPRAVSAAITPQPVGGSLARQDRQPHINILEGEGVDALTAGQRTGSHKWQSREEFTKHVPLGPNTYDNQARTAARQFTRAAMRHAGIDADNVRGPTMQTAITNFGNEYEALARASRVNVTPSLVGRLETIVRRYRNNTPQGARINLVENIVDDIRNRSMAAQVTAGQNGTVLSGEAYRQFYKTLRDEAHTASKGGPSMNSTADALNDILDQLNTAMIASAPRGQQRQLRQYMTDLNRRYSNFKLIEKAAEGKGEWSAQGMLSPARLGSAVIRRNGRDYVAGRTPMGRLARAGEAVLRPLPTSGTAERNAAKEFFTAPGNQLSASLGGAGAIYGGGVGAGVGVIAGQAIPPVMAHTVMSRPFQRWLSNTRIPERWPRVGAEFQGAFAPAQLSDTWDEEQR